MQKIRLTPIPFTMVLTIMFAVTAIWSSGCSTDPILTEPDLDVEQAPDADSVLDTASEPIGVVVGKTLTISLESNPTTGYMWQSEFDSEFLELVSSEFTSDSAAIGSPGVENFEFKALKQGETEVTMIYKRSWENEYLDKQIIPVKISPQP